VTEADVYVCESLYEEAKRLITKLLREGIKKYQHSGDVQDDEIYFFRRLINPAKVNTKPGVCLCAILIMSSRVAAF
jgi:protein polybromo-1